MSPKLSPGPGQGLPPRYGGRVAERSRAMRGRNGRRQRFVLHGSQIAPCRLFASGWPTLAGGGGAQIIYSAAVSRQPTPQAAAVPGSALGSGVDRVQVLAVAGRLVVGGCELSGHEPGRQ